MATIETRRTNEGDISYRAKVRLKGLPSQSATFERKTDAKEWAKQTETAMRQGRYFITAEAKKHTVEELINRYLNNVSKSNPKRFADVKKLLAWWKNEIGVYLLSDVTKSLIIQQRDKLLNTKSRYLEKRTPATVNRYMTAFRHVLTVATNEWEWVSEHPMRKISSLTESRGRIRYLDESERKSLLEACCEIDSHLYLLVVLALSTGARHGELINLRWKDVDFTRQAIVLHYTKNKERRVLPLTHHALDLMKQHSNTKIGSDSFVFSSSNTKKPWNSRKPWLRAIKKSGITNFRFHDLRHSAASYLAMNGASLAEIAEVLGHKTLQMVKRYAHLSEAHTAKVVQRMNERIFG